MKCCTIKYVIIIVVLFSCDLISLCALFSDLVLLLFKKKEKKRTVCVLISIPIRAALTYVSSRETNAQRSVLNEVKGSIRSFFFSLCVSVCLSLSLSLSLSLFLSKAKLEFEKARVRFFSHSLLPLSGSFQI
jgi:hypothetical protein